MRQTFDSAFALGSKVLIDGDRSIAGTVIAVLFKATGDEINVAWMANGDHKTAWIDSWRLTPAEPL